MKRRILFRILCILALIPLIFFAYGYFAPSPLNSDDTDLTANVNDTAYQVIYLDKHFGTTKIVSACFDISPTGPSGYSKITKITLKSIRVSGLFDVGIHSAYFTGSELYVFFVPNGLTRNIDVKLPNDGIPFNTSVVGGEDVQVIGVNWSDYVKKSEDLNCFENFSASPEISEECFRILSEAGRICNLNCVHE
ncbi:MAG: hypothetical protein AAGA43_05390 [Bacteroidota bacterium]